MGSIKPASWTLKSWPRLLLDHMQILRSVVAQISTSVGWIKNDNTEYSGELETSVQEQGEVMSGSGRGLRPREENNHIPGAGLRHRSFLAGSNLAFDDIYLDFSKSKVRSYNTGWQWKTAHSLHHCCSVRATHSIMCYRKIIGHTDSLVSGANNPHSSG